MLQLKRVASRSWYKIGEFGGHRLAKNVAAGCAQQRDAGGVCGRHATSIDWRSAFGRDAGGFDYIFDADWQPQQRTGFRTAVESTRNIQCALGFKPGKRMHITFALLDSIYE